MTPTEAEIDKAAYERGRREVVKKWKKHIDNLPTNYRSDAQECVMDFKEQVLSFLANQDAKK